MRLSMRLSLRVRLRVRLRRVHKATLPAQNAINLKRPQKPDQEDEAQ